MGGKWTTYRRMAQDGVDKALAVAGMPSRPCVTQDLRLHGALERSSAAWPAEEWLQVYGTEAADLRALMRQEPALAVPLHPDLPYTAASLVWGLQHEQARSAEDLLFRRTRMGLLHAMAAQECMPAVAQALLD